MLTKDLSKNELVAILDVIERARNCMGTSGLKDLIMRARELVSADYAICGIGRIMDDRVELVSVINGNYPTGWLSHYTADRLYYNDPVLNYLKRFSITQFWDGIFRDFSDPRAREVINYASEYDLKTGISTAIYMPDDELIGVFSFASGKEKFTERSRKIVDMLALHLNKALFEAVSPAAGAPGPELNTGLSVRF
ncbi:MAG: autoinducer binding domain-containing protein [Deltaproteobacteria bacterium]|nr:autoinducer binding domain-containing protein [Deltaproteobacteria bacterium]